MLFAFSLVVVVARDSFYHPLLFSALPVLLALALLGFVFGLRWLFVTPSLPSPQHPCLSGFEGPPGSWENASPARGLFCVLAFPRERRASGIGRARGQV